MGGNIGRPSDYTEELAKQICKKIAEGYSLRKIEAMDDMPSTSTMMNWNLTNKEFLAQYTRAKEQQADAFAEQILDIADNSVEDVLQTKAVERARLRIESRKWLMGKMKPKKYGDSTQLKLADNEGGKLTLGNILNEIDGNTSGI